MADNLVENYGWDSIEPPHSCNYIIPEILKILRGLDVSRILDLGSGNGKLCSELVRAGYYAAGVENDGRGVELSRSNYPEIEFYNYGVEADPAEVLKHEDAFDVVVSTEVVEHLFSPHLLPVFARSVLADSGYLIVTTPYHGYFKNLSLSILNKWDFHHTALWHGGHIKFWSRTTLSSLLEKNGFEVIGFSGVGRFPYMWKSMILVGRKK